MYRPGDLIMKSQPWVYCIKPNHVTTRCYRCLQKAEKDKVRLSLCTGCGVANYCSKKCQVADWTERHKAECRILGEFVMQLRMSGEEPRDMSKVEERRDIAESIDMFSCMSQMLQKLQKNHFGGADGDCDPPTTRTFHSLVPQEEIAAADRRNKTFYERYWNFLVRIDKKHIVTSYTDFARLCGKFIINGVGICDFQEEYGRGLYLGPSGIHPCCNPNSFAVFEGTTLFIKAAKNIESFEDVTMSYNSPTLCQIPPVREKILLEAYYFRCECSACIPGKTLALRHAVKCFSPSCSAVIPLDDVQYAQCPICYRDASEQLRKGRIMVERVTREMLVLTKTSEVMTLPDKMRLNRLLLIAREAEKVFHPTNFLMGAIYWEILPIMETLKKKEWIAYAKKALIPLGSHPGKYLGPYGSIVSKIVPWMAINRGFKDMEHATELGEIYGIVYGAGSEMHKTKLMELAMGYSMRMLGFL